MRKCLPIVTTHRAATCSGSGEVLCGVPPAGTRAVWVAGTRDLGAPGVHLDRFS